MSELFDELSALLARPEMPTPTVVTSEVKKMVRRFQASGSPAELAAVRLVAHEVFLQIDRLAPSDHAEPEERAVAAREDAYAGAALDEVLHRRARSMSTPESLRAGRAERTLAVNAGAATLKQRIENGELIASGELQRELGVKRQAISAAMKSGRLFAFVGPSGENYYPAFFLDPSLDRRAVEKVSKALATLPAASKYYFFTEKFTALHDTPLGALRNGRLTEVLAAAASVVGR